MWKGENLRELADYKNVTVHEVTNVFVVDTSFMPTGLGLNPMVNVVANALRVGTRVVSEINARKTFGGRSGARVSMRSTYLPGTGTDSRHHA